MFTSALACLALTIYHEARNQDLQGQIAVAQVVLERVYDSRFPDTVCGVVTDGGEVRNRCAFSFYCDGQSDKPQDERAYTVARWVASGVLSGAVSDVTGYATHYHAYYVRPDWALSNASYGRHRRSLVLSRGCRRRGPRTLHRTAVGRERTGPDVTRRR
jgi:spore germination cell wall hydrolase CwlJ-like protein